MKYKRILLVLIVVIVVISAVLLFLRSYSLEIDSDEVRLITWGVGWVDHEISVRDEIEEIVSHLNAWSLVGYRPRPWDGVDTYPLLLIMLSDEDGNSLGGFIICRMGFLFCRDSRNRHRITRMGISCPVADFVDRFG